MRTNWVGFYTLFKREFLRFFKVPNNTIFPQLITVLFYFLIFGIAIGSRIQEVAGVPYFLFILPGLFVQVLINGAYSNPSGSLYMSRTWGSIIDVLTACIYSFTWPPFCIPMWEITECCFSHLFACDILWGNQWDRPFKQIMMIFHFLTNFLDNFFAIQVNYPLNNYLVFLSVTILIPSVKKSYLRNSNYYSLVYTCNSFYITFDLSISKN